MATPVVSKQHKALQTWIKLRTKRAEAVASKPAKHATKSSAVNPRGGRLEPGRLV